jgi:hypothetical protein
MLENHSRKKASLGQDAKGDKSVWPISSWAQR